MRWQTEWLNGKLCHPLFQNCRTVQLLTEHASNISVTTKSTSQWLFIKYRATHQCGKIFKRNALATRLNNLHSLGFATRAETECSENFEVGWAINKPHEIPQPSSLERTLKNWGKVTCSLQQTVTKQLHKPVFECKICTFPPVLSKRSIEPFGVQPQQAKGERDRAHHLCLSLSHGYHSFNRQKTRGRWSGDTQITAALVRPNFSAIGQSQFNS